MADNTNVTLDARPATGSGYLITGGIPAPMEYAIDPADTPILYRLRALDYADPINRRFFARISFSGLAWIAGATLTVYGRSFSAARYPAAAQFFDSAAADMGTVVDSICTAINEDPYLSSLYSATREVNGVQVLLDLVAKQPGSAFNLDLNTNLVSTIPGFANACILTPTTDENRAQQLQQWGYGFMLKVFVPSETLNFYDTANVLPGQARWVEIASLAKDYGGSPVVDFDVSRYVRPYASIPLPDPFATRMQRFPLAAAAYKVQWGEYFRGGINEDVSPSMPELTLTDANFGQTNPIYYRCGESPIRWAAPGAFRLDAIPADYYRWWQSVRPSLGSYATVLPVTERPATALVRRTTEPSWLYFWLVVDKRGLSYQVRMSFAVTYHDGTTATTASAANPATDSGLCCLPPTPNLALLEAGGKRVAGWVATVQVRRGGSTYAPLCSQAFTLDTTTEVPRYRTFYWENRFGTLDCFTFEGVEQATLDKAQVTYTRGVSQQRGLNTATGKTRIFESQTLPKQTVVSGWVDRPHLDFLAGMLRARNVWIVENVSYFDEGAGRQLTARAFTSVLLGSHDWKADAREKLFTLSVDWTRAMPENVLQA